MPQLRLKVDFLLGCNLDNYFHIPSQFELVKESRSLEWWVSFKLILSVWLKNLLLAWYLQNGGWDLCLVLFPYLLKERIKLKALFKVTIWKKHNISFKNYFCNHLLWEEAEQFVKLTFSLSNTDTCKAWR